MEKIIFECETITPMFLAGADGVTPELRAPSIKGALRFWWRAMNGHLSLADLRNQESEIFGGTDPAKQSLLTMKILNFPTKSDYSVDYPTPHKKNFQKKVIKKGFVFNLQVGVQNLNSLPLDKASNLFILFSLFGALGNRSRRGFGSFKINRINGNQFNFEESRSSILGLIEKYNPDFNIKTIYPNSKYPYLLDFKISTTKYSVSDIGKATHDVMFVIDQSPNKEEYKATLGAAYPRFSSPIYISYLPSGHLLISTLNAESPNMPKVTEQLSDALIKKLS